MDDWKDIFFKSGIRAIMTAPRGRPSYNLLDAFYRDYNQHELDKCFSEDKKNNRSRTRRAKKGKYYD